MCHYQQAQLTQLLEAHKILKVEEDIPLKVPPINEDTQPPQSTNTDHEPRQDVPIPVEKPGVTCNLPNNETTRLPKLSIPIFSGNTLQWQSFWDYFEAAVHHNF